jgi:hypothetical protein
MPYCAVAIRLKEPAGLSIESLLDAFAKEEFKAQAAHHLHGNEYNIDAGLNDVRAVVDFDKQIVSLVCRYEKDLAKTERKAQDFAAKHPLLCEVFAV